MPAHQHADIAGLFERLTTVEEAATAIRSGSDEVLRIMAATTHSLRMLPQAIALWCKGALAAGAGRRAWRHGIHGRGAGARQADDHAGYAAQPCRNIWVQKFSDALEERRSSALASFIPAAMRPSRRRAAMPAWPSCRRRRWRPSSPI
jgi:hypothetical protein